MDVKAFSEELLRALAGSGLFEIFAAGRRLWK